MSLERAKESIENNFFKAKIGNCAFFNLVGKEEETEALLDALEKNTREGSFCVRVKLKKVSAEYTSEERYAFLWKQIVDRLAEVVSEEALDAHFEKVETQDTMYEHWVNDYQRSPQDLDVDASFERILNSYKAFAGLEAHLEEWEASTAKVDKWIQNILFGYDELRVPVLLILENFDVCKEVFPKEEGYGGFFTKLFWLSPKDQLSNNRPHPSPMGVLVVSEIKGKNIAHSMNSSSFEAAYPPIGDAKKTEGE